MSPSSNRRDLRAPRVSQTSTPTLLNEVYTRLRVCAAGLEHACGQPDVSGLHVWMNSYGARLMSMAEVLLDEGAKQRNAFSKSAENLYLEDTCKAPTKTPRGGRHDTRSYPPRLRAIVHASGHG